jgi:hypothetical protein
LLEKMQTLTPPGSAVSDAADIMGEEPNAGAHELKEGRQQMAGGGNHPRTWRGARLWGRSTFSAVDCEQYEIGAFKCQNCNQEVDVNSS